VDDFADLYAQYKEMVIIVATAAATLLSTKLLPWLGKTLGAGVKTLKAHVDEGQERTSFEERYRRYVAETNRFLQVTGIKTRTQVSIELDRVYVGLELKRRAITLPNQPRSDGAKLFPADPYDMPVVGPGSEGVETTREWLARQQPTDQTFEVGEALRALDDRLVILGAPGSGKTTLVKYLAVTFAERKGPDRLDVRDDLLPILIPLRDWVKGAHQLEPDTLGEYVLGAALRTECPAGFFRKALESGRCLVLLDGMDEVSSDAERAEAARQIDRLVAAFPANHYVVTSRPAGYEGVSLSGFAVLRVRDFTDEDVEAFARRWALAVEVASRGATEADEIVWEVAKAEAERQADDLVRAIREKDRVRQLAVNPLLLTIVALVHRYRAVLPDRRVELYDECVQVLLNYWDAAKGIAGQMEWRQKRRVLEELALAMHERRTTWLPRAEVEEQLRRALPLVGEKPEEAEAFLDEVRTRSGLLVERGVNEFGFSHLTFQEYLAALALRRQGDAGRAVLIERLDDAWWKEVLLLYAGLDDATDLLRDLLAKDPDLFLTPLFTAADVLSEAVEVEHAKVEEVVLRLSREWLDGEYWARRWLAYEAIIQVGRAWPHVLDHLIDLLQARTQDARWGVASAIGRLGSAAAPALGQLQGLLQDEDDEIRSAAAEALGELGEAAAPAVGQLVDLLRDEATRVNAAQALAQLGEFAASALGDLRGLLHHETPDIRRGAARALSGFGEAAAPAVGDLRELLWDEHEDVAESAAMALGRLGSVAASALGDLQDLLREGDKKVAWTAMIALRHLGEVAAPVVAELCTLLQDEDAAVRARAVFALSEMGPVAAPAMHHLVDLLRDESEHVRQWVPSALGGMGAAAAPIIGDLCKLLQDENPTVRGGAADSLGALREGGVPVVEDLRALLQDENEEVRWHAASAVGSFGEAAAPAMEDLRSLLRDESRSVRWSAADALRDLGGAAAPAVNDLLLLFRDDDSEVRRIAAEALRDLAETVPEAKEALIASFIKPDTEMVMLAAAIGLAPQYGTERPIPTPHEKAKSQLNVLLSDTRAVDNANGPDVTVRDVAWDLLHALHQKGPARQDRPAPSVIRSQSSPVYRVFRA